MDKQVLEDYIKSKAQKKGCTVYKVEWQGRLWYFIFGKTECVKEVHKQYCCSICGRSFNTRTNRNRHTRTVDCANKRINENKFKCNICGKELSSRSNRDRHKRTVHKPKWTTGVEINSKRWIGATETGTRGQYISL